MKSRQPSRASWENASAIRVERAPDPRPRRQDIGLDALWKREDVPIRFRREVDTIIHGDGYGTPSKACREALNRAGIGGVTLWPQPGEEGAQP